MDFFFDDPAQAGAFAAAVGAYVGEAGIKLNVSAQRSPGTASTDCIERGDARLNTAVTVATARTNHRAATASRAIPRTAIPSRGIVGR